ncbi:MAG: lysine--tRNA ligase [Acidiferrobacterales bacterium]
MSPPDDEQEQIAQRRAKLAALREKGNPFPIDFRRNAIADELHKQYEGRDNAVLEADPVPVKVAGRIMTRRVMGKASFAHLQDGSGQIQLFLQRDALPDGLYEEFKAWDIGDIVGAGGVLFKTKTGELSVKVQNIHLLTKALRPLPEKFHGLADQEQRYRQRYLDLIMNEAARRTFRARSAIIDYLRRFLNERGFLEVETPMMQVIPGGAVARPFCTHHHTLDMPLFLRVAPELYLKRLVVGGFERVYEINRSFRNEGVSTRHNPEFTMLEFYQAYADYRDLMRLTEEMLRGLAEELNHTTRLTYQAMALDLGQPFQSMTVNEAILRFNPDISAQDLTSLEGARVIASDLGVPFKDHWGAGKLQLEIFEKTVESKLKDPTFITAYPVEVSPLARRNDDDPSVADRFELYVGCREIANGFTELNDAEDQAERFRGQVVDGEAGDEEAMRFDADYIRALEHGMPPTAGEGLGVDRLAMLFTDSASIRDVLLFPHMRPESGRS